ncbi:MAG: glutamyl-tRNA reductase [Enterovirga sp.]|jgi:hypothetical protein|nr:glutamyl-tRNA reductase [Enterovirga sp.]
MNSLVMVVADVLVGVLLVATIVTSVRLSRRITQMKADEAGMRTMISELVGATGSAERAIAGLRSTLAQAERSLGDRIAAAETRSNELTQAIAAGNGVLTRIGHIADTTRMAVERHTTRGPAAGSERQGDALRSAIAAAQAVADRTARRIEGRAA